MGNAFASQKIESRQYYLKFYQKSFQIRIITSPAERNHSFPQGAFFQNSTFPLAKKEIMS